MGVRICDVCGCKSELRCLSSLIRLCADCEKGTAGDDIGLPTTAGEQCELAELFASEFMGEIPCCSKSSACFDLRSGDRMSDLRGYWHIRFILLHLEHFGSSSSHCIPILDNYYHALFPYAMRTLILRALHFSQPYRDFLCDLRVFILVQLSF